MWNYNIDEIVTKASKRLYIVSVLKRAGIPSCDLLNVYLALIRSVLEYCCVTWANSLPVYTPDKIERVHKRALGILFPYTHYNDALSLSCYAKSPDLILDVMTCALGFGTASVTSQNHACTAYCFLCVLRASLTDNFRSQPKCRNKRYKRRFFPALTY